MHRLAAGIIGFGIIASLVVYAPRLVADPAANPLDPAKEDLSRVEYPSLNGIRWQPHFIRPDQSLESLFGRDWQTVARFNRLDRRHAYPGMTIKVPLDMEQARAYTPMPAEYGPAKPYGKYILVNVTEQWIGAYEKGRLKFSVPAATGKEGHETPTGIFRVDARHRDHTSSLYKTDDGEEQYPMDYAFRFAIGPDNASYWIHSRDLPGKPASHGCVGLYNEEMQNRVYGIPENPTLLDAQKLYRWAVVDDYEGDDVGELEELENGPVVEVMGSLPRYHDRPLGNLIPFR